MFHANWAPALGDLEKLHVYQIKFSLLNLYKPLIYKDILHVYQVKGDEGSEAKHR
jgi:hypothetical protein